MIEGDRPYNDHIVRSRAKVLLLGIWSFASRLLTACPPPPRPPHHWVRGLPARALRRHPPSASLLYTCCTLRRRRNRFPTSPIAPHSPTVPPSHHLSPTCTFLPPAAFVPSTGIALPTVTSARMGSATEHADFQSAQGLRHLRHRRRHYA